MCLGTFDAPLASTRALELPKQTVAPQAVIEEKDATSVHELLSQALQASQTAPNRAVKRRVRQRLHKKLGAICNKEEFDEAMEQFKVMELQLEKPKRRRNETKGSASTHRVKDLPATASVPAKPLVNVPTSNVPTPPPAPVRKQQVPQVPQVKTQLVAVPIFYQANNSVFVPLSGPICAVQSVHAVKEKVQVATESVDLKVEQQVSTTEEDSELSSLSSEEPKTHRTFEGWPTPLPVERTFIQFSTRAYIPRRRSRSQ